MIYRLLVNPFVRHRLISRNLISSHVNSFTFLTAFFLIISYSLFGQDTLHYQIAFPNAVHHEAEVSLTVPQVPDGALTLRMSRSSPGRYATHEFGKNIYHVKAFNEDGKPLMITQAEGDVYEIARHGETVKITYTVFGNRVDGTYLAIDETHAHMNMPATFMWVKGMENRPVKVLFNGLEKYNWKVATQLKPEGTPNQYTAPNLQYFMDSPTELSAYELASWQDMGPGNITQTIRISSHTKDGKQVVNSFANMVERTVKEAKAVFGELPEFDHGTYTFLHDIDPENAGDGMEHRNSTVITEQAEKLEGNEEDMLSTFSHEFFHAWNVERIRPKSLEPFNFEQANMSSELWFAEGFTQYYGDLILKRAGYRDLDAYCNTLGGLLNYVLNAPGSAAFPATQMSRYAVFADAGVAIDQTNQVNIFTSYYYYGAVIALALDLQLRTQFKLTLDDYMQAVWKAHGKTEKPYTVPDLQQILAKLTNQAFAGDFYKKYVYGTQKADYSKLLANAGLVLRKAMPGKASLGPLRLVAEDGKMKVALNTVKGSAAYEAGLDAGDYLLKIGNGTIKAPEDIPAILQKYKPGDEVGLTYEHRSETKTVKVKLQENNALEVVPSEQAGVKLTPETKAFRENWLSSKIK